MAKLTLKNVLSGLFSTTALNTNFDDIEAEVQNKVLYRDNPPGEPNSMQNDLDMNSKDLLNAKAMDTQALSIAGVPVIPTGTVAGEIPVQTGNAEKFLTTNGAVASWDFIDLRMFDTLAAMVASTTLVIGQYAQIAGRLSKGDGGSNIYEVVAAATGTDDGGTFIDLNTLQAKGLFVDTVFNVKQFGAKGDGTTDDSAAIQAALDAVNTLGGGTVFFPQGTYRKADTSASLVWFSNTRILGAGWDSIILHDDTSANPRKDLIEATSRTNISMENIFIDGTWDTFPNETNQSQTITITDTDGVRLTNVKISRVRFMATSCNDVTNAVVSGCYLDQIARDGFRFTDSQNIIIDGNNLRNVSDDCVALHATDTPTIATGHGFVVTNNTFEQCQGIKVLGSKQLTIDGNVFKRCIRNPIFVTHSTGATEGDTVPFANSITNNTFIDTFSDFGTNFEIRLETPDRASPAQPIPGFPNTSTGVGNAPYSFFYTNELDTTVLGMYHTVISGNTFMRTLAATTNFSDYGFEKNLFDRAAGTPGFIDPATTDSSWNTHNILFNGNMRGVLITDNTFSGIRGATHAILFSDPGLSLDNTYENVRISNNLFFDITSAATILMSGGFNGTTQGIEIEGNTFDPDSFFIHTGRNVDGTWDAAGNHSAIALNGTRGIIISNNKFRNCSRVIDNPANANIVSRNYLYADFSGGGGGDNALNAGIRVVTESYPDFIIIPIDGDPTSATFNEITHAKLLESSTSIPTTGFYVKSHFVRNSSPSIDVNNMVELGWLRLVTGSAHVSNTDWAVCHVSTVTPAT